VLAAETVSSPQVTGVEMTGPVRQSLDQIQDQWLQWMSAWFAVNGQRANQAVDVLLATARQLGMTRLPDLAFGAMERAVQAAGKKEWAKAHIALDTAERLDPGRPETEFARMTVARLEGDYLGVLSAFARSWPRLFRMPLERYLWFQGLLLWAVCLLVLTGALFVALQMATKGRALFHDLTGLFGRWLPRPVATVLVCLVLAWPLIFPFAPLWLTLYWSVLLWGYASASERFVLAALWLLVGVAPLFLVEQQRRVAVTLSPPARALQGLEQHRLYGGLFADLGALRSVLPESSAVKHLLADVHRSLDQWELARSLYRQVLEKEPANTAALLNLGAYYFTKQDFGSAIEYFQKASAADPQSAAAQFDLSQSFYESYLFDEAKAAQTRAKAIDTAKVDQWIKHSDQQRIVTSNGGLARIPEIRRELLASRRRPGEGSSRLDLELFRRSLSVLLAAGLLLLAVTLHLARRPFGYGEVPPTAWSGGRFDRWRRILLPGLASAESGEGARSFLAILVPVGLLTLPLFGVLGYRIPWGYDPGNLSSWIVAILGLLLYLGARLRWELRNEV
jgi:tetratricopeptide (TPR) repeat protein